MLHLPFFFPHQFPFLHWFFFIPYLSSVGWPVKNYSLVVKVQRSLPRHLMADHAGIQLAFLSSAYCSFLF